MHPQTPMPRAVVLDDRRKPDHLDLIAERDGVPVGAASTAKFGGAPDGEYAYLTMRVLREERRQGVGTALHRRASEHARAAREVALLRRRTSTTTKARSATTAPSATPSSGACRTSSSSSRTPTFDRARPRGSRSSPPTPEYDRGAYEVALEADADIPSGEPIVSGPYEQWRDRHFGAMTIRELSFVALDGERVVGYAILNQHTEGTGEHAMTGSRGATAGAASRSRSRRPRSLRPRRPAPSGCAPRTTSATLPMRRVNEKLGYVRKFEWVHLGGPLLEG